MFQIYLKDSNYSIDEVYGSVKFNVSAISLNTVVKKTFQFNGVKISNILL